MKGWRRQLRTVICWWMQNMFFSTGFRLKIKGIRASEKEAPVLALAPHSTFYDAFPVVVLTAPSLVVKADTQNVPFFAKLINYTQPVYVWRDDPNSRQNTIKEIVRRATSTDGWQQVLIFPEGTCSNRTGLITFKPGAFYPGVPIQPVCIRYPNRLDTLSWTWQGPGALELLWLTLTQFCTYCELEFLPVYVPSEAEKRDPHLFARNVRKVMAEALQLPVVDYSYEDCRVMNSAKKLGLPPVAGLVGVSKLKEEFGLDPQTIEKDFIKEYAKMADPSDGQVTLPNFSSFLHLPETQPLVVELFRLYDVNHSGVLTFEKFIRGRCSLVNALKKMPSCTASWQDIQERLKLNSQEQEHLQELVVVLNAENNENDFLGNLYAAIPEWRWIACNLMSS